MAAVEIRATTAKADASQAQTTHRGRPAGDRFQPLETRGRKGTSSRRLQKVQRTCRPDSNRRTFTIWPHSGQANSPSMIRWLSRRLSLRGDASSTAHKKYTRRR